jgi:hypothetical protein
MRVRAVPIDGRQGNIFGELDTSADGTKANLSRKARAYLSSLTNSDPDDDAELSRAIWQHAIALIYAPAYLSANVRGICEDVPRTPLPNSLSSLQHSARLGSEISTLLDIEKPVPGVTTGKLRRELNLLGRVMGPKSGISLAVTCGWGHEQEERAIVMPGRGVFKAREYTKEELAAITEGASDAGISADEVLNLWGRTTLDIYLNSETFWGNVPENVWRYTIGGYQVLKKWLSYREHKVLGRDLTKEDARQFTHIARRIAILILLEPDLNENYRKILEATYAWPFREGVS